ncbi:MAG: hypothetical protein JNN32_04720 [Flavobacteriales bacterium]|nr:hypothetical protein [Flavobacteriales bacterium]
MPIWIDLGNLVITRSAVTSKYPGGMHGFRTAMGFDPLGRAHQEDQELLSFGAMELEDLFGHLQHLRNAGLHYSDEHPEENDMVLIARYGGPVNLPRWLRYNSIYAWHMDCAAEKQALVRSIVKLDVQEFLARQERNEIPIGTIY